MSRRKTKYFKDFSKLNENKSNEITENQDWKEEREKLVLSQLIKPRTHNQERLINSILTSVITFAIGCPGVGKTFLTCGVASKLLFEKKIEKIIITRPQVEVGGITQGFFPGNAVEKIMPYLIPMIDSFGDFLGPKTVDKLIKEEIIEIVPLGLMRGRSPKKTMIIVDEVQSCRYIELKTLLTRIDSNTNLVLLADPDQSDLKNGAKDLKTVISKLKQFKDEIGFVYLDASDCQRAGIVKKIISVL